MSGIPRAEYPRPQFVRDNWMCLNGRWQFEIDVGDSGIDRGMVQRALAEEILVPFCPESKLSGVGESGFMEAVWYRRSVSTPESWEGRRLLLHFQAVDHDATVWVNGVEVVRHRGGYTPFTADLGVRDDLGLSIVVRARDSSLGVQARGKQSQARDIFGAFCSRSTGIWQTVWLEPVPNTYILRPRITPDVSRGAFHVDLPIRGPRRGHSVRVSVADEKGQVARDVVRADRDLTPKITLDLPTERQRHWGTDDPFLYDLVIELVDSDGDVVDRMQSYAGLRSVAIDGKAVLLNGEPVFQRLVADQGYYPDGIYTAPSEEALTRDIELAQAAGFNGARLHQKVFEERFLYQCDRRGFLVWGEFADWGAAAPSGELAPTPSFITQWLEALERDYSHPSVVGWCPLNETLEPITDRISTLDDATRGMFLATKAFDATRPVLDTSGFSHRVCEADIYDSHNYEQDPAVFRSVMSVARDSHPFANGDSADPSLIITGPPTHPWSIPYQGQPYFCSEWGGILWAPELSDHEIIRGYMADDDDRENVYRYWATRLVDSRDRFCERFEQLASALLDDDGMFGYCYFQLYDTYKERLGIYTFDRSPKFDIRRLKAVQSRPAAIETKDKADVRT